MEETVAHHAAEYLAREVALKALVTVTHADMSPDYTEATIYFSVLPATMEAEALKCAKRSRSDFREYIRAHSRLHPIPTIDFAIDLGEKNRQRVDELTRRIQ